jgi:hypothetical protein
MSDKKELQCYVEYEGDIIQIKMWIDFEEGDEWVNIKEVKTNDLWDNISTREDLFEEFGEMYWDSLADYRKNNNKLFEDWFAENIDTKK